MREEVLMDLKPCPFCGATPYTERAAHFAPDSAVRVGCARCGIRISGLMADVVPNWNRRNEPNLESTMNKPERTPGPAEQSMKTIGMLFDTHLLGDEDNYDLRWLDEQMFAFSADAGGVTVASCCADGSEAKLIWIPVDIIDALRSALGKHTQSRTQKELQAKKKEL